ncbi:MAG TPA: diaminopimelate decarboxylase [Dongiaceae bacterium]|jgi:diaminopimelate decarboxylase|nr:diaminopimelate decarboxylase [Dongiaceae bacterium]
MGPFHHRDGALYAEDVPLRRIAEAVGTPCYVYSAAAITERYRRYEAALSGFNARIYYSVKANSNQAVVALLGKLGAGADVVSVGEMYRALKAGIAARDVVFAGVGKTRDEMAAALDAGIHQFNVESRGELQALNEVALGKGKRAPVALRINPDVDALTHAKISTGKAENKFGIDLAHAPEVYAEAAKLPGIEAQGLACHIGSQLLDIAPYKAAFGKLADLTRQLRASGLAVQRIDLGGGVGVAYKGEPTISTDSYVEAIASTVGNLGCALEIEPGRSIVAEAGLLLSRVINVKSGVSRKFVIVDAAMNDLIRPALYDAYHEIVPVDAPADGAPVERMDIVGPICETGDQFAAQRPMPPVKAGDFVAFSTAGAYGAVMASTYNTRPLVPEVMVKGAEFAIVRPRPTYDAMIGQDIVPTWV